MRTFYVLKQDESGDIAKIVIPSNLSTCMEDFIIAASYDINIDCCVFPMHLEGLTYRNLFGDNIQNLKITETWKNKNFQVKIVSWEMKPR